MPTKGSTMSEEQRAKISASSKALKRKLTPEHRAKLAWAAHLRAGEKLSPVTRERMSKAQQLRRMRESTLTKEQNNDEESV